MILFQLLSLCNITHDGTLPDIVAKTQAAWLRKAGTERWQISEKSFENPAKVRDLLTQLGMVNEVLPPKKQYDAIVIFGGTLNNMRKRLAYAEKLITNQKISAPQIVFLVGQRMSDPKIEEGHTTTETELARLVYAQSSLSKTTPALFVDTPAQGNPPKRPTTADTIVEWIKQKPSQNVLFISSNPHIGYQAAVAQRALKHPVDIAGPATDPDELIAVYLDALARWLYEEKLISVA